jgi:pimeloyl-ACP methyl ester carboxylesterase
MSKHQENMATLPHRISGSGPAVVLIHGAAPDYFDALERELARDHSVVRLDRRGFGNSGLPGVKKLTPHAQDIAAIVDALGSAVVVGWSMGGIIALEAALLRPQHVRGLVLLEPPWLIRRAPTVQLWIETLRALRAAVVDGRAAVAEIFLRWALRRRDGSCELDELPSAERARVQQNVHGIVNDLFAGSGEHIAAKVKRTLDTPTTLFVGTDSQPEFAAAAKRLAKTLKIEPQVITGAGHLLQETHAPIIAEAVRRLTQASVSEGASDCSRMRPP